MTGREDFAPHLPPRLLKLGPSVSIVRFLPRFFCRVADSQLQHFAGPVLTFLQRRGLALLATAAAAAAL